MTLTGGESSAVSQDATLYFDSIGLGSDQIPYAYMQGTSMASPVATGVTAVIAGMYPEDSAAKLAARVKGAVRTDERYEDLCSTGGAVTVSGADDSAPVPVEARRSDDVATVVVRGYFIPEGTEVSVDGMPCAVLDRIEVPESDGLVELTVQVPSGFDGGEAWVVIQAGEARGRLYANLGADDALVCYDQLLEVPSELEAWGDWDLVSFDGALYVLPREGSVNHQDASYTFFMKYDSRTWSRVAFPLDQMAEQGIRAVTSVSGTVYRGALVMQVTGTDAEPGEKGEPFGSYWRYNADGTWDYLPIELPEGQSLMLSATASDGEHLYAFGGWGYFDEAPLPSLSIVQGTLDSIVKIDIDAGTGP